MAGTQSSRSPSRLSDASFDLREQPWIPVVRNDGTQGELNLTDTLHHAHELAAIRDAIPLIEFGLYRLLSVLVYDIFELEHLEDLEDLLAAGRFATDRLDAYFSRHCDRFDLFSAYQPFLQTAGFDPKKDKPKPLSALFPMMPSGTNVCHFLHEDEGDFRVHPAVAARLLITIPPFQTMRGAGLSPSINGAPPWYVLIQGDSLFETLCLNCYTLEMSGIAETGVPTWRSDRPVKKESRSSTTLLEGLTWQPRRVQLIPERDGECSLTGRQSNVTVGRMRFAAGWKADLSTWRDPSVAYRMSKETGWRPVRPAENKEVWRDSGPLLFVREDANDSTPGAVSRPSVLNQLEELASDTFSPVDASRQFDINVYGLRTDLQSKIFEWHKAELRLPIARLSDREYARQAHAAIDRAERVAGSLRYAIKLAFPGGPNRHKQAFETLITREQRRFWSSLHPRYQKYLTSLAELPTTSEHQHARFDVERSWATIVRAEGWESLKSVLDALDSDADALKRSVDARRYYRSAVRKILAAWLQHEDDPQHTESPQLTEEPTHG